MPFESTDRDENDRLQMLCYDYQPERRGGYGDDDDEGLSVLLDPNPYMTSWRSGESPRGAYFPGLLAFLHPDPTYYRDGYASSCGYEEHKMGGFDSSGTCTSSSSDSDFIFPDWDVLIADDFSSNAGNIKSPNSNGKTRVFISAAGIDIGDDSNSKGKGSKLYDRDVNYVFRGKVGTDAAEEAAKLVRLSLRPDDNTRLNIHTTIDPPSYNISNARIEGGGRLVEVFSFLINNNSNSGNDCGDIYGGITVHHSESYMNGTYIFHRFPSDPKCVSLYDDTLSLFGPGHVILFYSYFKVILDLKGKDGDLFPKKVRKRTFSLDDCQMYDFKYGKPMSVKFDGNFGSATMYYTIFDNAVEGRVNVELFKRDQVYGTVVARYSDHDYYNEEDKKYYQSVLFYEPRGNAVKLKRCKFIPISKVVAVPISSSLVIEVDLWNRNQFDNDDQIAKGIAVFSPRANGETSVKDIKGDNGFFALVSVAWSSVL